MTVSLWLPRRAPNLNALLRAKSTVYGKGKVRTDAYAKLKASWAETVELCARLKGPLFAGRCLKLGRVSVHYDFVEPNRRRDPDNLAGGSKVLTDGLVKAGVLAGDGWDEIAGLSFSWRVGSPAGVLVTLTPEAA